MRALALLAGLALAAFLPLGAAAEACSLIPMTTLDSGLRGRDLLQGRRALARSMTWARRQSAEAALAGGADAAAGLATMLVPNVQPILIERGGCGPENEIDHGAGEETPEGWLAGTPLEGRAEELDLVWRQYDGETLGQMCNAEFRGRFAAHMRRRLSEEQVREAYLFLASRWVGTAWRHGIVRRLARFEGDARRPPLRWSTEEPWQEQEIRRWMRLVPLGRATKEAIDGFWSENAAILGDAGSLCPEALARWPAVHAQIIAEAEEELARRDARRAGRTQPPL